MKLALIILAALVGVAIALAFSPDTDAERAKCIAEGGSWDAIDGIGDPVCVKVRS